MEHLIMTAGEVVFGQKRLLHATFNLMVIRIDVYVLVKLVLVRFRHIIHSRK